MCLRILMNYMNLQKNESAFPTPTNSGRFFLMFFYKYFMYYVVKLLIIYDARLRIEQDFN